MSHVSRPSAVFATSHRARISILPSGTRVADTIRAMRWTDSLLPATSAGRDVLVVARSTATARAIQLELARLGRDGAGWPGLRIATVAGLLGEASPGDLLPRSDRGASNELPPEHPWAAQLADRPLLRDRLAAWLDKAHALVALGQPVKLSEPLAALLAAGWGRGDDTTATQRFLARPPSGDAFAVGFEGGTFSYAGRLGRLERAIVSKLGARVLAPHGSPSDARGGAKIPCWRVADVHAEARAAAMVARGARDVLVLVADDTTADRVRATLSRNGIAAADDDGASVAHHALAAAIRPLVPVFESKGDAALDVEDLERLLASPVVRRRPRLAPPAKLASPVEEPAEDEDEDAADAAAPEATAEAPRLSRKRLRDILVATRRRRLPVKDWVARLDVVEAKWTEDEAKDAKRPTPRGDHTAEGRALSIASKRATLGLLRDTLVALHSAAQEGTLGALGTFARKLGPRLGWADAAGTIVVDSLRRAGHQSVTVAAFDEALASNVGVGALHEGARLVSYDAYDGRSAQTLVLCDVHDAGVGRVPSPNPFLSDDDLRELGLATGADAVRERLDLARWAARIVGESGGRVVAIASGADASGRAVSLPVDLANELEITLDARAANHGFTLATPAGSEQEATPLPELHDLGVYVAGAAGRNDVTVQIDAEWVRTGAVVGAKVAEKQSSAAEPKVPAPAERSLPELLKDSRPAPDALAPFLGLAGEDGALAEDFVLSASRLEKLTQCLYKGFAAHVLRLKERDDVTEEADARQRGTDVHEFMEKALVEHQLTVPAARIAEARAELAAALAKQTRASAEPDTASDDALATAQRGSSERQAKHWGVWVENRVQTDEEVRKAALALFWKNVSRTELARAVAALSPNDFVPGTRDRVEAGLKALLIAHRGDSARMLAEPQILIDELPASPAKGGRKNPKRAAVEARLDTPEAREAIATLGTLFEERVNRLHPNGDGDDLVESAEVPIAADPGAGTTISLGALTSPASGSIDALVRHRGPGPETSGYIVLDHKTGSKPSQSAALTSLVSPQLAFYALAAQQGLARPKGEPAPPKLPVLAVMVDATSKADETPARWPFGEAEARRAHEVFGEVLQLARAGTFPLAPHPLGCPLEKAGYCDYAELCRYRERAHEIAPETTDGDAE